MRYGTEPYRLLYQLRAKNRKMVNRKDVLALKGIRNPDRAMGMLVSNNLAEKTGRGQWRLTGQSGRFGNKFDATAIPRLLLDRMIEKFSPSAVILFGSRARGTARPDSDWDILVLVPDNAPEGLFDPEYCWQAQRSVVPGVHADVIPKRISDFDAEKNGIAMLAREAYVDGVVAYER